MYTMAPLSLIGLLIVGLLTGCGAGPANPAFSVTSDEARTALRKMANEPRRLERPVVVVGGYLDPNISTRYLTSQIMGATGDARLIRIVVGFSTSFEECRDKVIDAVDAAFPNSDPDETTEVDVIGASLGGLVARYAAAPSLDPRRPRRLKVARLFTISSPHRGARLAQWVTLNDLQADMKPGSKFLTYLAECDDDAGYEVYPYVCRGDWIVGEEHAAPPGVRALWVAGSPWHFADGHRGSLRDARIVADIGRRLRGEEAFSQR